jgi:hypothetical protein
MLKNLFIITFSNLLLFPVGVFQTVSGQTANESKNVYAAQEVRWIRNDLKVADVVAYVDAKEIKIIDTLGKADCEKNTGSGYCLYLITAQVKELFKGSIKKDKLEFYVSPDASFPKNKLIGEQVVFLVSKLDEKTKKESLHTIENSTRDIEIVETIRKILDPNTPVDENDEFNPYSMRSLKADFKKAYAVIFVIVRGFSKSENDISPQEFILNADTKEVFKGDFVNEEKIKYRDDLLYRPFREEDLGKQIVFLEKNEEDGKVYYTRINYTADKLEHNVLEKLRKIAGDK